jgi:benzoyl-CoA-dihydrodiol lyase
VTTILKLNSYDLGVDIELADAIQRVRFEHPEVRALVITIRERPHLLLRGEHLHARQLDPRLQGQLLQVHQRDAPVPGDAGRHSGVRDLCALNGTASGGGYELALACDKICLRRRQQLGRQLPEVPLLAVLPGTGGLTRLVDKRKVRRDLADVFSHDRRGHPRQARRGVAWSTSSAWPEEVPPR